MNVLWAAGCWREFVFCLFCFLQLLLCIFFTVMPPYCCSSRSLNISLYIYSSAICLWVYAVFSQAAVGSWISGNMVHPWWNPQVLLTCQCCKSVRQFDVLWLQTWLRKEKNLIISSSIWMIYAYLVWLVGFGITVQSCLSMRRPVCWVMIVLVFQGNCFYHGEVLGMEGSSVALSTCSGLR